MNLIRKVELDQPLETFDPIIQGKILALLKEISICEDYILSSGTTECMSYRSGRRVGLIDALAILTGWNVEND